ncbi:septum site-determining protein MinC [Fervidobacterium nodosum]|uniref:Probable septum site-determining protein MinC n=1 Tax=Fervidobacterium nodosum (strain ATCC 35602 / DSM 5306 / Rt17-B1) TaxID=381764 RepID=A7HLZ0_FERNB|nr:septum site-determining protein MinC [Fervidobacterium nodosum]ABS60923.1 septum site-determining protein MinC [Fervidobacterium nodosum Rt17-B1]HOJ93943.1 septum site-determining protein MinC [Fervidobacterium nodosum]
MVDFKMTKDGLVLYIKDYTDIFDVLQKIEDKVKSMGNFFAKGDKIMLLIEEHEKHIADVPKIVARVQELGLTISHVLMGSEGANEVVVKKKVDMVNQGDTRSGTKIVKKNLRSGQSIIHSGDVILLGNLHAGAEIVAGGSVVIFGRCQGIVRAGINEGRESVIATLSFEAPFVQISDLKGTFTEKYEFPCIIYVKSSRIEINKYDNKLGGINVE